MSGLTMNSFQSFVWMSRLNSSSKLDNIDQPLAHVWKIQNTFDGALVRFT